MTGLPSIRLFTPAPHSYSAGLTTGQLLGLVRPIMQMSRSRLVVLGLPRAACTGTTPDVRSVSHRHVLTRLTSTTLEV